MFYKCTRFAQNVCLPDHSVNSHNLKAALKHPYGGLFDTAIALQNGFDIIVKHYRPFIQILHTSTQHWICIGNLQTNRISNNRVNIYDNLSSDTMTAATASQIASICNVKGTSIEVVIQSVQQQRNGTDCGVFALAFATSLAYGEDPSKTSITKYLQTREPYGSAIIVLLRNYVPTLEEPFPPPDSDSYLFVRQKTLHIQKYGLVCDVYPYLSDNKFYQHHITRNYTVLVLSFGRVHLTVRENV